MPATIVLGGQWGDEGKGKITDMLAGTASMVVRANGGSNAGHTVATQQGVFKLHLVPSGILNPSCDCVIGAGVVVDPIALASELEDLEQRGVSIDRLLISDRAHVVLPFHPMLDELEEELRGGQPIGTTLKGIGPAYADKVSRVGLRMADLLDTNTAIERIRGLAFRASRTSERLQERFEEAVASHQDALLNAVERLATFVGPSEVLVQDRLEQGDDVIIECAQGCMLDIDYGTYPYVTSSSPTAAGACQGAGIAPNQVDRVIGVFKAYSTRVGAGPMPAELNDDIGDLIRQRGNEFGTTTGRPRRTGWFDGVAARHTVRLNGVTEIAITLVDVFDTFSDIAVCSAYDVDGALHRRLFAESSTLERVDPVLEHLDGWLMDTTGARSASDLPLRAVSYIERLEALAGAPVTMIGVGPEREQLAVREIAA